MHWIVNGKEIFRTNYIMYSFSYYYVHMQRGYERCISFLCKIYIELVARYLFLSLNISCHILAIIVYVYHAFNGSEGLCACDQGISIDQHCIRISTREFIGPSQCPFFYQEPILHCMVFIPLIIMIHRCSIDATFA